LDTTDLSSDLPSRFIDFSSEYEVHWWYLEFFLFFTPLVEKLTVHDAWQWDDHHYWFKSLAANPSHFENLQTVTVLGPLRLRNIVPLLTLPSIRVLELTQATDMRREPGRAFSWASDGEDCVDRRLASGSSLECLVIKESELHIPSAMAILDKLDKLKSFTYEHVPHELTILPVVFPWIGNMGWGLARSFENLRLRLHSIVKNHEMSSLFHHVAGPVLGKIRTLDIGPCNIETFRGLELVKSEDSQTTAQKIVGTFPNTLESLQIQWAFSHDGEPHIRILIDILRSLVEAVTYSASKLKQISIVDWPALAGWFPFPEQMVSLKHVYERSGMQFDVVYEEIESREPLIMMGDVEPDWLWIHKTEAFAIHSLQDVSPSAVYT
jgi:hypothetical protein